MSNWQEMNSKYLFNNYTRWPILPIKGKGSYLWDENGKKYLDLMGGWAVCSLGHSHPVMIKALTKQAKLLTQAGPYVCTLPQLQLAEILVKNSCLNRVFFSNSGAKLMRVLLNLRGVTASSNLTAPLRSSPLLIRFTAGPWR